MATQQAVRLTEQVEIPQRVYSKSARDFVWAPALILEAGTEGVVVQRNKRTFFGAANKPETALFTIVRIDNDQWRGWVHLTDQQIEWAR